MRVTIVTVVAMHTSGAAKQEILENILIVRLKYLPERWETLQETRAGIPAAWKKNKISIVLIVLYIIRMLGFLIKNGYKFEIIHAQWTISSFAAMLYKPFFKGKVVTTVHGSDVFSIKTSSFLKKITKVTLLKSDRIICVSSALKSQLENWGIDSNKISVIPNGVDLDRFPLNKFDKEKIILFVGSLTKNKNVNVLIQSFAKIHLIYNDYKLIIIGDGDELSKLKDLAFSLKVENSIEFVGSLSPEDISKNMLIASIFVLPAINEGFGVVLVEALAAGLPCIGSNSGGITDIITENVGYLFTPNDFDQLTDILIHLIDDKDCYQLLSKNARLHVEENFQWKNIVKKFREEFENI